MGDRLMLVALIIAPVGIISGVLIQRVQRARERRMLLANGFDWFKSMNPALVRNGRVTCPHCRGNRVHVRNLMEGWYVRAHFCTTCGKTLYYSPEGNS